WVGLKWIHRFVAHTAIELVESPFRHPNQPNKFNNYITSERIGTLWLHLYHWFLTHLSVACPQPTLRILMMRLALRLLTSSACPNSDSIRSLDTTMVASRLTHSL